jgi:hypothetical protein
LVAQKKNEKVQELEDKLRDNDAVVGLKYQYHNNALAEIVQNQTDLEKIAENNYRYFQIKDPIFREPESNLGKAHFYAPYKKIAGLKIDTLWFNVGVLWIASIVLYIVLYFDWLRLFVRQIEKMRLRKVSKRIARIIPS